MERILISNINIKSFRSLRNVEWQPGTLNVVIGQNASGKSNLLKFLQFVSASADGRLREYIDQHGGLGSILWGSHDTDLAFSLRTDNKDEFIPELNFDYSLHLRALRKTSDYKIESETCHMINDLFADSTSSYDRDSQALATAGLSENTTKGLVQVLNTPETLLSTARSPFVTEHLLRNVQRTLSSFLILDDFHSDSDSVLRRPVTSRREIRLTNNGQNLPEVLHSLYETDYEFKESIDVAMSAVFGDAYKELSFPPAAEQQIQLGIRWSALKRPEVAANLSDGTLRFLFTVTALSMPDPPVIIAIDEPETGLHPTMMRVIAEYAADAALRSQIIFTTHSTAFLDAFSKDDPPTVTVAEMQNGETTLKVVDPDLLAHWLSDYSLGSLYRSKELEQMNAAPTKVENAA